MSTELSGAELCSWSAGPVLAAGNVKFEIDSGGTPSRWAESIGTLSAAYVCVSRDKSEHLEHPPMCRKCKVKRLNQKLRKWKMFWPDTISNDR